MRIKRGKLVCEINQLLVYEKEGKYSVYSPRNKDCLLHDTCLEKAKEFARHFTKYVSDWCTLGYSRTEARKLMHEGNGEFMRLPNGLGYVRFAI